MASLRSDIQIAPQDLFQSSTTQLGDLGARATTGDGRYFRLIQAGTTALVAGKLAQASVAGSLTNIAVAAASAGAVAITTTGNVTVTANQLAGGLLSVRSGPGAGFSYRIKSHAAASAAVCTFNLDTNESVQVALTTSSKIDVQPSIYANSVLAPGPITSLPIGVVVGSIPASSYGWIQTHGPTTVWIDGAVPVGNNVSPSLGTAGAVVVASGGTNPILGWAMYALVDQAYEQVFLTID